MKRVLGLALLVACFTIAAARIHAQTPQNGNAAGSGQSKPAAGSQGPASAQQQPRAQTQTNSNPFPEDTSSVPVMPNKSTVDLPPGVGDEAGAHIPLPEEDLDPVRSPEDAGAAAEQGEGSSSSSLSGMGNLLPGPDDDAQPATRGRKGTEVVPEDHETAAEDENVGSYYLDNKNWKAALSRYQSALVLDPDNPEVYWGLAEAEHHLGSLADARANYQKVVDYDPDSRHGKDARKALKDPEIANARPASSEQSTAQPQK